MPTYGTTDRLTGGTATADSCLSGLDEYGPDKACDDNAGTRWVSGANITPNWWKYDFGAAVKWKISKVTITNLSPYGVYEFNITGSNDDITYSSALYSGSCADNGNLQTFTFTNKIAYRYIKVGGITHYYPTFVQVVEFQMFEGIYPAGGGLGIGNPWIFMKDMWEKHNKIWTPKLILPEDLGFSY